MGKIATITALLFGVVGLVALSSTFSVAPKQELFQQNEESDPEVMNAYIQFISEYGRSYASKQHATDKFKVFKRNYETIKEHNKHESVMPFVMKVNQFADMTAEEF